MQLPGYAWLAIAIVAEVIGTSALRAADGFTRLWPSVLVVAGYGVAFYCLSLTLRTMPVGIIYAVWSARRDAALSPGAGRAGGDRPRADHRGRRRAEPVLEDAGALSVRPPFAG